jgi:hypothetical protein
MPNSKISSVLQGLAKFRREQRELFEESVKIREELEIAIAKRDKLSSLLMDANLLVYHTRVARDKVEQQILDNKEDFFSGANRGIDL